MHSHPLFSTRAVDDYSPPFDNNNIHYDNIVRYKLYFIAYHCRIHCLLLLSVFFSHYHKIFHKFYSILIKEEL